MRWGPASSEMAPTQRDRGGQTIFVLGLNVLGLPCKSRTPTLSEALRLSSPADLHPSDEWVVYVACLFTLCLFLQVAGFAGRSPVAVVVSVGLYFAGTAFVQGGTTSVRLGSAAMFTTMMTLLGYGLSLVIRP